MFVFGIRGHGLELLDVSVPDPEGEELDAQGLEQLRRGPGITAVRVSVRDEENGLAGLGPAKLERRRSERC